MGRAKKMLVIAVVVVGVIAGIAAGLASGARVAAGDTFVASVRWSSAVVTSTSARTIKVFGDVEGMDARFDCGPVVKSKATETATTVVMRVEVFNRPLPPNVACAGVGLATVPATIHLTAPIGNRTLVDATDHRAHRPLVVNETPTLTSVRAPFVRRSTGWDESTGQIGEWWRWQKHGEAQQIDLNFGPAATAPNWVTTPANARHVWIEGRSGVVFRQAGGDTVTTTVTWSTANRQSHQLMVIDQSRAPLTEAAVLTLARSFR